MSFNIQILLKAEKKSRLTPIIRPPNFVNNFGGVKTAKHDFKVTFLDT
jgi:hypothetical protein